MAPSTIQRGIERNQQRLANGGSSGTPLTQPVEATPAPNPPGAPPQDIAVQSPQRGVFPASLVLASDRSDSARAYRGAGMRSAVMPFPPSPIQVTTAAASASKSQAWDSATTYEAGQLATYNSSIYQANQANQGAVPPVANDVQNATAPNTPVADDNWTLVGSGVLDGIAGGLNNGNVSTSAISPLGLIDLSLGGVVAMGSVSPIGSTPFSYSSTTTSITILWNEFIIYPPGGSETFIGVANGSITITGLTAGTTYLFFPYWNNSDAPPAILFVQNSDITTQSQLVGTGFNGTSGQVTTAVSSASAPSTDFSIATWVYPTVSPQNGGIIQFNQFATGSSGTWGPVILLTATNGVCYGTGDNIGVTLIETGIQLTPNFWNLLVFSYGGNGSGKGILYINDVAVPNTISNGASFNGFWNIGKDEFIGTNFFTGVLGPTAIFAGTALTAAQVTAMYQGMTQGSPTVYAALVENFGATYFWPLQDLTGTTATEIVDSNPGTYSSGVTLGEEFGIGAAVGTAPGYATGIAWVSPTIATTIQQFLQKFIPLSGGGLSIATTATGTGGGASGGFSVPGIPNNLVGVAV